MDILTHAGIGLIAGAPFVGSRPELAVGLVAGSVLPDLDAVARVFGKRAYLRAHQTWSHALPVQAGFSTVAGCLGHALGGDGFMLGIGLFAGLALHSLLDWMNTLGVTLLAPFSRKRFCREWIFFIDAIFLLLTVLGAGLAVWRLRTDGVVPPKVSVRFFTVLADYVILKALFRIRAGSLVPDAISLVPSALCPWHFFGVIDGLALVRTFRLNAISGRRSAEAVVEVYDSVYAGTLAAVPEFGLMRELSPAYHVVGVRRTEAGEEILCRDLRTRNFGTKFGELEVQLDPDRRVTGVRFHV